MQAWINKVKVDVQCEILQLQVVQVVVWADSKVWTQAATADKIVAQLIAENAFSHAVFSLKQNSGPKQMLITCSSDQLVKRSEESAVSDGPKTE